MSYMVVVIIVIIFTFIRKANKEDYTGSVMKNCSLSIFRDLSPNRQGLGLGLGLGLQARAGVVIC